MLSLLGLAGPEKEMSQQDKTGELLRATDFPNWYLSIDQHISKKSNRAGGKKRGGEGFLYAAPGIVLVTIILSGNMS